MSIEVNSCLICNSNELTKKTFGQIKLFYCPVCDIHFNSEIPEKDALENYYQKSYKITESDFIVTEKRRLARIPEQFSLLGEISQYFKAPAKLLDIGCDKGFFLDEARRIGYDVTGVEPSETARNYCSKIGLNVFKDIEDIKEKFNIITLWHSLEHNPEPKKFINLLKSKLELDGYLFIRVPAFDSLWSKILKSRWIWFQPQNHYFHFSHKSLNFLLSSQGFDVQKIEKRRPNTRLTRKAFWQSQLIFSQSFDNNPSFTNFLKYFYQATTAVELFAVAKFDK
ncbi:MAG: class I SAM-dependent methyltransferase [Candidatus Kapabacteria bacterium]|nr:class I SAM-dependent methyltransferase [Candidatus Kapabacteria bacterium]